MPRYTIRHSQFGVISGLAQPTSDMALALDAPGLFAPESRKGQLFIIAEPEREGGRSREACQLVIRTIRKQFYDDTSFSVTSSLRKAIVAANRALYQQNFSAPPPKRGLVGVTCVVAREGDLYIAQVAPAQIYILSEGRLRAVPGSPTWGTLPAPAFLSQTGSIGASLTIEPELHRATLRPGESVLLCSTNLAPLLTHDDTMRLLSKGDADEATRELSARARIELGDAHGIIISYEAELSAAAQAAPLSPSGVAERGRAAIRAVEHGFARATGELMLMLRGPVERRRRAQTQARLKRTDQEANQLYELPEQPAHSPDPPSLPRPLALGETLDERLSQERETRRTQIGGLPARPIEQQRRLPPSAMLGEPGYSDVLGPGRRIDLGDPIPRHGSQPIEPAFRDGRGALGRLNGYFEKGRHERRMRRVPPRNVPKASKIPGLSYRRESPPFPWRWLLALVSLIAILFLYGINLTNQNQIREADTGLTEAEAAVAAVYAAPDEVTARELLRQAAAALDTVRATNSISNTVAGRQRLETLQREYDQALMSIQKVSYFEKINEFAVNPRPGALFEKVIIPPVPRGITDTTAFGSIYMLDSSSGILYQKPKTGGTIQAMLRPEDRYGPLSVGRILGIDWRFDTIVAVTQSIDGGPYNFYFRNRNTWSYSLLAGSEEWGSPGERFQIANYDGNLYVWGVIPGDILRYPSGAYGEFPGPWIENDGGKQFDNSLDMAVDGRIYLLQPDGRVFVFSTNAANQRVFEREIVVKDIDPPIQTVSHFAVTGDFESGFIFLVDSFYSRIIQIDKRTGEFIQQIKADPSSPIQLVDLVNVAVDTGVGRPELYLVNGSQILRAPLPDRPRPFREGTPTTGTPAARTPPSGTPAPTSPVEPTEAPSP